VSKKKKNSKKPTKNLRLAHTAVYLLRRTPNLGLTQLLKLIFFADFTHYRVHLKTITGMPYVALARGPVIDNYEAELKALESRGFIYMNEVPVPGQKKPKQEYLALAELPAKAFTAEETTTLDEVLLRYGARSGVDLSDMTHEELTPWKLVWDPSAPGASIPHSLFRWVDNLAGERDVQKARERVAMGGRGR